MFSCCLSIEEKYICVVWLWWRGLQCDPAATCGPAPPSAASVIDPGGRQTRLQLQRWTDLYCTPPALHHLPLLWCNKIQYSRPSCSSINSYKS